MRELAVDVLAPRSRPRRRWRLWLSLALALLCIALGGFAGLAIHKRLPAEYRASSTLLVLPTGAGLDSSVSGSKSDAQVQIETEAELLRSSLVAADASALVKGSLSAKELLKNSAVTVPPSSQVLIVSLVAPTPAQARDGANALAQAYLTRRNKDATAQLAVSVNYLKSVVTDLTSRLTKVTAALADVAPDDKSQRELLASQKAVFVDNLADTNSRLVTLQTNKVNGGQIVTKAEKPDSPSSPGQPVTVAAGLLVGLLAAGGLLLALSQLRAKRRVAPGPATPTRVPVLATLALSHPLPAAGAVDSEDVRFVDEDEVLRRLCMKISTHKGMPGPTVIVGVGDPVLRTRLAASLNRAWAAEFGSSVLVLTEHGDHVSETTGVPASAPGLLDALRRDTAVLDTAVVPVGTYGGVVGPGLLPSQSPTAAERGLLPEVWNLLEAEYGQVLVQTGSPLDSPLAQSVAVTAGRFVVLVEVGIGQRRDLTSTLEEIEWLDLSDRVAGVVIVSNHPAPVLGEPEIRSTEAFSHETDRLGGTRDRG